MTAAYMSFSTGRSPKACGMIFVRRRSSRKSRSSRLVVRTTRRWRSGKQRWAMHASKSSRKHCTTWQEYEAFAGRDLSEFAVAYFFVDGVAERLHPGLPREAVLCAWGITEDGRKVLLHLAPSTKQDTANCTAFFEDLKRRGLADPLLVVTDGPRGCSRPGGLRGGLAGARRTPARGLRAGPCPGAARRRAIPRRPLRASSRPPALPSPVPTDR